MTTFVDVINACAENGISVSDVDRILLNEETISEFQENMETTSTKTSDYATIGGPAVRETDGPEKIVWVDQLGVEHTEEL